MTILMLKDISAKFCSIAAKRRPRYLTCSGDNYYEEETRCLGE